MSLLRLYARGLDDLAPLGDFAFEIAREFLGAAPNRLAPDFRERRLHGRRLEALRYARMERVDYRGRRSSRREECAPRSGFIAFDTRFVHRRNLRKRDGA